MGETQVLGAALSQFPVFFPLIEIWLILIQRLYSTWIENFHINCNNSAFSFFQYCGFWVENGAPIRRKSECLASFLFSMGECCLYLSVVVNLKLPGHFSGVTISVVVTLVVTSLCEDEYHESQFIISIPSAIARICESLGSLCSHRRAPTSWTVLKIIRFSCRMWPDGSHCKTLHERCLRLLAFLIYYSNQKSHMKLFFI